MNIRQAKAYITDTVRLYLKKDADGEYVIPVVRQRPIFLLGAPGIGKTAIMEQVAQETGVALVSYSMTHHTRQSALGLPFISHRVYGGQETEISEYTMSEIIASIYDVMEESGIREGILFLDEINCVSETLAPSILQFLQYKTFGKHRVPGGWVIVTAGNPPEYNKSVREFDVVTMDRLRVLEVEEDYEAWKVYAKERGLHDAVTGFLDLKKEYFYRIETTVGGRSYVTARGWEDLSVILKLYEQEGLAADQTLVGQYLRNPQIAKEFSAYYDLYRKYKQEYPIEEILAGRAGKPTVEKAAAAPFDERLSLLGMLIDKVQVSIRQAMERADSLSDLSVLLKGAKAFLDRTAAAEAADLAGLLEKQEEGRRKLLESKEKANTLSASEKRRQKEVLRFLAKAQERLRPCGRESGEAAFAPLKEEYDVFVKKLREETEGIKAQLHGLFVFTEQAFSGGNELLILMTELTVNENSARFIGMFGCSDYQKHNEELLLSERQEILRRQIADLTQ